MKPKAVNVLDQYDLEVLRTWKVRGAILCEADKGLFILKEFGGHGEKLLLQDSFLSFLQQKGFSRAEMLLRNREGSLMSLDQEESRYIVKSYVDGRECRVSEDMEDGKKAMQKLAELHLLSREFQAECCPAEILRGSMIEDYEKHNRELKKVKRFLREKGQKNEFEHFLKQHYEFFLSQALEVTRQMKEEGIAGTKVTLCHGDFQYHNILFREEEIWLVNFEKCIWDNRTRDICHFTRKMLEKHNWQQKIGEELLSSYEKVYPLSEPERKQLYYRFSYPEKFWKVVNYYYNSAKAFIPGRYQEKLELLLSQEKQKKEFIKEVIGDG